MNREQYCIDFDNKCLVRTNLRTQTALSRETFSEIMDANNDPSIYVASLLHSDSYNWTNYLIKTEGKLKEVTQKQFIAIASLIGKNERVVEESHPALLMALPTEWTNMAALMVFAIEKIYDPDQNGSVEEFIRSYFSLSAERLYDMVTPYQQAVGRQNIIKLMAEYAK